MKKLVFVLGFVMATALCAEGHNVYNNKVSISIQTFYNELAPYGEWIYTPEYGYAWRPYLDYYEEFQPYATRGNWVNTDLGWTWISEYRWGWATFHYGRWFYDNYFGWMWLPGYEWAPAWVIWGSYNDCWAWAPMGPNMNAGIYYSWHPPSFWWTFVPFRHFCSSNWHSYIYDRPVQVNNITYINNYYDGNDNRHNTWTWDYGPRVPDVERHTRTKVQKITLVDADKPGAVDAQANQVKVYRPGVEKGRENTPPAEYKTLEKDRDGKVRVVPGNSGKTTDPGRTIERKENRTQPSGNKVTRTTPPKTQPPAVNREVHNTPPVVKTNPGRNTPPPAKNNTRVEPVRKEGGSRTTTPPKSEVKPVTRTSPSVHTTPSSKPNSNQVTRENSTSGTYSPKAKSR